MSDRFTHNEEAVPTLMDADEDGLGSLLRVRLDYECRSLSLDGALARRWKDAVDGQAVMSAIHGQEFPALPWKAEDPLLVTSVEVDMHGAHDHVKVWSRHGLAGTLVVAAGDGDAIARRLLPQLERSEHEWTGPMTTMKEGLPPLPPRLSQLPISPEAVPHALVRGLRRRSPRLGHRLVWRPATPPRP